QVETGSSITWKYPSCILRGDNSIGEFYSVAISNNYQQADTGSKMIHLGKNTSSTIISKGISLGHGKNTYRGLVKILPNADDSRNFTQCDSLLIGGNSEANTIRHIIQVVLIAKIAFTELPIWIIVIFGLVVVGCYWCLGKFWDLNKGYDCELEWSNSRNPTLQIIKSNVNTKPTLTKRKA
ncbi:hypothetical protein LCGC14_2961810, partial [marine sediment metagenome]